MAAARRKTEFQLAWEMALQIDAAKEALAKAAKSQTRYRRLRREIEICENFLTPPARRGAIIWQRRALAAVAQHIEKHHCLDFTQLVKEIQLLAGMPCAKEIRRFLNSLGFLGKAGRRATRKHAKGSVS